MLGHGAPVLDACCGIGGDAMGLADAGLAVTAADLDPRRAWMAGHNAGCGSLAGDVRQIGGSSRGVHADPARRSGGKRTRQTEDFDPPLPDLLGLLERAELGALKLHPGVHADGLPTARAYAMPAPLSGATTCASKARHMASRSARVRLRLCPAITSPGNSTVSGRQEDVTAPSTPANGAG